jgi:hypothetical protein
LFSVFGLDLVDFLNEFFLFKDHCQVLRAARGQVTDSAYKQEVPELKSLILRQPKK